LLLLIGFGWWHTADGLSFWTKIKLHASLWAIHPSGGTTVPAEKPKPQQCKPWFVHLHSRQSGAANLNEEPGKTFILLYTHCWSILPYSKVDRIGFF